MDGASWDDDALQFIRLKWEVDVTHVRILPDAEWLNQMTSIAQALKEAPAAVSGFVTLA